jgi:hypothetical protein
LQEGEVRLQAVLVRVGFFEGLHLRERQRASQGLSVYWHKTKRGGEGFGTAGGKPCKCDPMRRPQQGYAPD